ncbi:MAG: helix-turn-helix domain-containing protein [Sutterella parvirubra]|nr:helix-turn-helix domain-containing protein [Sutterella parvirubra]
MLTDTLRDPLRPTFAFAAFDEKRPTEAGAQDAWPAFLASFPEDVFTIDGTRTKPLAKAFGFAHRRVFCPAAVMSLIDAAPFTMRLEARAGEPGADPAGLLYVASGKLSVIRSEQTRRLSRNEALILDPSQPMTVTCQEETEALLILVSTQYFLTHVGVQPRLLEGRQLSASRGVHHAFLLQTLRHFAQELPRIDPADTAEFCDGIFCFLRPLASAALREHTSLGQSSRDARRTEALLIMERRFTDPTLTSGAIARELGISTRYLDRIFAETGMTVRQHLMELRLGRASVQLREPHMMSATIADIAKRNGFVSPAHFARAFKARYRYSPKEWRSLSS